jgi:hypothetical protein
MVRNSSAPKHLRLCKAATHGHDLTPEAGREIHPGETISFEADVAMLPTGKYILKFDLVSEGICWSSTMVVKL